MNNKNIGNFISECRKAKGLTQKQLAEKLYVSDKAVSKWERNICLFDISLIQPLADILGVSVSELLEGKHLDQKDDQEILTKIKQYSQKKIKHLRIFYGIALLCAIIITLYLMYQYSYETLVQHNYITYVIIALCFGGYCAFFTKLQLPDYYDENRIHFISTGIMRINMPGIRFNNNNWFKINQVIIVWSIFMLVTIPFLYMLTSMLSFTKVWITYKTMICIVLLSSLFIPLVVCAKRYE